jgi:hypothetical protein
MKAIPVTMPATAIEVFQAGAIEPCCRKKNAVVARQAIDTSQKVNPTKSSG